MSTKNEDKKSPERTFLDSLGKDAARFFKDFDGNYTELFGNNFDFSAASKATNYNFNTSAFNQPPGTEPLNFFGEASALYSGFPNSSGNIG